MKKGELTRVSPASAYASFCCCVGYIWTIISYIQVCSGINTLNKNAKIKSWTIFIPIYFNIYISNIVKSLNEIIEEKSLNVAPITNNVILNFLFPFVPLFNIFKLYNLIVESMELKDS